MESSIDRPAANSRTGRSHRVAVLGAWLAIAASSVASGAPAVTKPLPLPGGEGGIGFDDMQYDRASNRVLVPAGRSGNLDLIDPATGAVTAIAGFSKVAPAPKFRGHGITSVDVGDDGYLFTVDRTSKTLAIVDSASKTIAGTAALANGPDFVRYVAPTHEIWVTEPRVQKIEIFSLSRTKPPIATHAGFIDVKNGPESLVIDAKKGIAYTNLEKLNMTLTIDLKTHALGKPHPTGTTEASGLVLDEEDAFLLVGGGDEGTASVLDLAHDFKILSTIKAGKHVDSIAYDPAKRHLYVPGGDSATMAVLGVTPKGETSLLGIVPTAKGAKCVTLDGQGKVYICDPSHGQLLVYEDNFPATK